MSRPLPRPLYLMIKPPEAVAQRISAGHRAARPPELLHLTLLMLGDRRAFSDFALYRLIEWLGSIRLSAFRIAFDRIHDSGRSVALRGSRLMPGAVDFHAALVDSFARRGIALPPYRFSPHITLDYRSDGLGGASVDPITWLVEDFRLIESVHGEARHIEHGRFALRPTLVERLPATTMPRSRLRRGVGLGEGRALAQSPAAAAQGQLMLF